MANEISTFSAAGLPQVNSLTAALRNLQPASGGGFAILKMDKTGHWVYGADQTEVEDDSIWAVNPFSFVHGYIAWGDGVVLGEKMTSISNPKPPIDAAPAGATRGWEDQIGLSLKCVSGEDAGLEVRYSSTSVGGKRAVQDLGTKLAEQVDKDQTKPVAMVLLKKEHYQHKSYGKIFTPIFDIQKWASMEPDQEPELELPAPAPAGRKRPRTA
jgi:hypothetical protein